MAFKTFYCVLLLIFLSLTAVKGSCLEYGHSCWGAHGKRSGNNQIHHADTKPATEVDFADLNAIKESPYDSSEDHLKNTYDIMSQNNDLAEGNDATNNANEQKVLKLENLLFKQLNKNGKHRMPQETADNLPSQRTNEAESYLNERWRSLPIYNLRRFPLATDTWLNDLEREQRRSGDDTADYI